MENPEILLEGIVQKPFRIERINAEASDIINEAVEKYPDRQTNKASMRGFNKQLLYSMLISSNSLADSLGYAGRESTQDYHDRLNVIVNRLKVEDTEQLVEIFMEVNRDFLEKRGVKFPTKSPPAPSTPSPSSPATASNTPPA